MQKLIYVNKPKLKFSRILSYTILVLLAVFFMFPFFIMVSRSFMTRAEIQFQLPSLLLPSSLNFDAYISVLDIKMLYFLKNTLVIVAFNVIATPLTAAMCAYGFSKVRFIGKKYWFSIMLGTMMIPGITLQIPMYIIYAKVGWIKTTLPLIVPAFMGGGAGAIFLIMQFMKGIPKDLHSAAKIDGANEYVIFARIILPLIKPIVMFFAISTFLAVWNDFMGPLMYLKNERNYTLALGLYKKFQHNDFKGQMFWNMQMAAGVLLCLPCVVIFALFQKQLIDGVTFSGLKI